jgi:hypothetical protein
VVASEPTVECGTVDLVGMCDLSHRHAPLDSLNGSDTKFVSGVLCFLHPYVVSQACPLGKSVSQIF